VGSPRNNVSAVNTPPAFTGIRLDQLALDMSVGDAFSLLQNSNISGGVPLGDALVFEQRYFSSVHNRQRLVIVQDPTHTKLDIAAVLIDVDIARGSAALRALVDDVRDELTRSYGRPRLFEQGRFDDNIAANILSGDFIYLAEWELPGGVLRMGLPERLDGQIRLEVQYKQGFSSVQETAWSIEDVR